jgi:hypothetical protein
MSSKVSLIQIKLNKVNEEWKLVAKLVFENENGMEEADYFPCN